MTGSRVVGTAALLGASACFQAGAAVAVPAFAVLGPARTSALRFAVAAMLMLCVIRPSFRRTAREWVAVVALGIAIAAMTVCSYEALARIPQGTATTLEFLGPLSVAVWRSRRWSHFVAAALAAAGVALIAGPSLQNSPAGVAFGLATAAAFAAYVLLQGRIGCAGRGFSALALSLGVAALGTLPLSLTVLDELDPEASVRVLLSGLIGAGAAYALDAYGIARVGSRQAGVLLGLDPAIGALSGLIILGQRLGVAAIVGIAAAVGAGVVSALTDRSRHAIGGARRTTGGRRIGKNDFLHSSGSRFGERRGL